mmetsp:Transcript_41028/g.131202  ORF Transcript_41028/g.131202 Transcript_41028/m.131202 type:complete len:376 (-) Transcript_41028:70-1197(-)
MAPEEPAADPPQVLCPRVLAAPHAALDIGHGLRHVPRGARGGQGRDAPPGGGGGGHCLVARGAGPRGVQGEGRSIPEGGSIPRGGVRRMPQYLNGVNSESLEEVRSAGLEFRHDVASQTSATIASIAQASEAPAWKRAGRCAVVGSSGAALTGRGLGREIDGHDLVFRMNDAPTAGFEQDVGARTDFRVSIPEALHVGSPAERALLLMQKRGHFSRMNEIRKGVLSGTAGGAEMPTAKHEKQWFTNAPAVEKQHAFNASQVHVLSTEFMDWAHQCIAQRPGRPGLAGTMHPTTGFLSQIMALIMCDDVTAYGFARSNAGLVRAAGMRGHIKGYHYYEVSPVKKYHAAGVPPTTHDYAIEHNFRAKAQALGVMKIV